MSQFSVRSSTMLVKSWSWHVDEVDVVGPGDVQFRRQVVRHPGAVTVAAVHDDDTVTLVRQYRAAVDGFVLEACAGTRDVEGEPEVDCAARELLEEAGLIASAWTPLGSILVSPGLSDERNWLFLAEGLEQGELQPHGPEEDAMQVERFTFDQIAALLRSGELCDAKTVITLARAAHALRERGRTVPTW